MGGGVLAMSALERERLVVLAEVGAKGVSPRRAAERLGICVRQVKGVVRAYRDGGDGGIVSRQRGRASNHQLASGVCERVRDLLGDKYRDFGPTLAAEKLAELEGIAISRETFRQLQIKLGLGKPSLRRPNRAVRRRHRRARFAKFTPTHRSPDPCFTSPRT